MADDELGGTGRPWGFDEATLAALRLERARDALKGQEPALALVEAEELLDSQHDDLVALGISGAALLALGDAPAAAKALEGVVQRQPEDAQTWAALARARLLAAEPDGAVAAADTALGLAGTDPLVQAQASFVRGLVRRRAGDPAGTADLERAARLLPDDFPLRVPLPEVTWRRILNQARTALPGSVAAFLDGVSLRVEDHPRLEDLRAVAPVASPLVRALAPGTPPEDDPWSRRPEQVLIYRDNVAWPPAAPPELVDRLVDALCDVFVDWTGEDPDGADEE